MEDLRSNEVQQDFYLPFQNGPVSRRVFLTFTKAPIAGSVPAFGWELFSPPHHPPSSDASIAIVTRGGASKRVRTYLFSSDVTGTELPPPFHTRPQLPLLGNEALSLAKRAFWGRQGKSRISVRSTFFNFFHLSRSIVLLGTINIKHGKVASWAARNRIRK